MLKSGLLLHSYNKFNHGGNEIEVILSGINRLETLSHYSSKAVI